MEASVFDTNAHSSIISGEFTRSVSAIVLAAGLSSRMGDKNKLLLDIEGQTLIERTLATVCQHPFEEVMVVLGHQAEAINKRVKQYKVQKCLNNEFEKGQMTSVHKGLSFDLCKTTVVAPTYKGQRGNPIILDFVHREDILANDNNLGCKRLLNKHPELVTTVDFDNDHVVVDMDTPDAYQAVLARLTAQQKRQTLTD